MLTQERPLRGGSRFSAGRAGNDGALILELAELRPQLLQRRGNFAGVLAVREIGDDVGQTRIGFRAARLCMSLGLDDKKRAGRPKRETGVFLARPNRSKFVPEVEIAEFIENQQILALTVLRTADQRDIALSGGDTCERDSRRVDAGGFLAHEGAR